MTTELATVGPSTEITPAYVAARFLMRRKATTMKAYGRAISDFAEFCRCDGPAGVAAHLFAMSPGQANAVVMEYQSSLQRQGLSNATINLRIAAIRSLTQLGKLLGAITWEVEVEGLRYEALVDTSGPGASGVKLLAAAAGDGEIGARDLAIVRSLYGGALRRGELVAIDVGDFDPVAGSVRVVGKGQDQRKWVPLTPKAVDAISRWLAVRGKEPGPMFIALDRNSRGQRLTGDGVAFIVRKLSHRAGIGKVKPHGLRHAAITVALDQSNGNVREVREFARHARVETTLRYDDQRHDLARRIASRLDD